MFFNDPFQANVSNGCDPSIGKLIYDVATNKTLNNERYAANVSKNRVKLLASIAKGDIHTPVQLRFGIEYCSETAPNDFNDKEFEKKCGIGVTVSKEEISNAVDSVIKKYETQISTSGTKLFGKLMHELRNEIPFADGKLMNMIFNEKFKSIAAKSGSNGNNNKGNKKNKNKNKSNNRAEKKEVEEEEEEEVVTMEKWLTARDLPTAHNTDSQLASRKAALKNKDMFLTRFPPEPNGFLHIGHCKAMTFNFELASRKNGNCYLRFDDTNPEAEEQLYIDNIIENVKWMGFNPWKITYSSDYFDELIRLAIEMIKNGDAYVCHQQKEDIERERQSFREKKPKPSPWRDTPIKENLRKFELMRMGYYAEGEAVLRMKGDVNSPNPNMWDHVAYRIKFVAHPHVGDKYCVYPTYDYTHCIIDSLEWITASCCTLGMCTLLLVFVWFFLHTFFLWCLMFG